MAKTHSVDPEWLLTLLCSGTDCNQIDLDEPMTNAERLIAIGALQCANELKLIRELLASLIGSAESRGRVQVLIDEDYPTRR